MDKFAVRPYMGAMTTPSDADMPRSPGRPTGSHNIGTVMREFITSGMLDRAREILQKALDDGDQSAARFLVKHCCPRPRGAVVQLDLPATDTLAGVDAAQEVVVQAMARGEVATGDAERMIKIFDRRRRTLEARDLVRRLEAALAAQAENFYFATALHNTARGAEEGPKNEVETSGSASDKLEQLERHVRPDLERDERWRRLMDRFFDVVDPIGAERVRAVARRMIAEREEEKAARDKVMRQAAALDQAEAAAAGAT
jgi:hypothetical protein